LEVIRIYGYALMDSSGMRVRVIAMDGAILLLHLPGFFIFIVFVLPAHYKGLGTGLSLSARLQRGQEGATDQAS
jgi:hypothetical protein